jgi:hypothetical protein
VPGADAWRRVGNPSPVRRGVVRRGGPGADAWRDVSHPARCGASVIPRSAVTRNLSSRHRPAMPSHEERSLAPLGMTALKRAQFLAALTPIHLLRPQLPLMWSAAACRRCLPHGLARACSTRLSTPRIARGKPRPKTAGASSRTPRGPRLSTLWVNGSGLPSTIAGHPPQAGAPAKPLLNPPP